MRVSNLLCAGIMKSQDEDCIRRLIAELKKDVNEELLRRQSRQNQSQIQNQNQADTQTARERSRKRITQPSSSATEIIQNENQSQSLSAAIQIRKACMKSDKDSNFTRKSKP